ncbi:MAG: hypothetical protein M3376_06110 [Actinomycetota bacterium]|nr:hypothetical protein [Actinomycetota bacterium]
MSGGSVAAIACAGVLAVLILSGCESSQTKSARLRAAAKSADPEKGLAIKRAHPDVRVTDSTVLTDKTSKRSAAVITLRNLSRRTQTALPLLFTLTDASGKEVFSNDLAGASADLTTVPSLKPGGTLVWVNDVIVNVAGATAAEATVGVGKQAGGAPPRLRVAKVRLENDEVDGATAVGMVYNDSTVVQNRLVIFAVARRGSKIVAAGRAVVPKLKPGPKGARFTLFFVGDPGRAKLSVTAPAVSFR